MIYPSTNKRPDRLPLLYRKPEQANQFMRYWLGLEVYHYNQVIQHYAHLFAMYNTVSINQTFQVLTQSKYYYEWFFNQWYDFDLELCNCNIRVNEYFEPREGVSFKGVDGDGIQLLNKRFAGGVLVRENFEGDVKKFTNYLFAHHIHRLRVLGIEAFENLFHECQKEFEPSEVSRFDKNPFNDILPYFQFL